MKGKGDRERGGGRRRGDEPSEEPQAESSADGQQRVLLFSPDGGRTELRAPANPELRFGEVEVRVVTSKAGAAVLERLLRGGRTASQRTPELLADYAKQIARVTPREMEVWSLVAEGRDNMQIASVLEIAERTVKVHVSRLLDKLEQESRVQLALLGARLGLVYPG